MIAIIKMSNWHQIEVSLDSPEDVAKINTFINEGMVVILAYDKETIDDEDGLSINGKIEE